MSKQAALDAIAVRSNAPWGLAGDLATGAGMAEMVLSHLSERSILHSPLLKDFQPFEVAGRSRYATCSGVAWFRGHHLAVVNLYGGHLRVYRFHSGGKDAGTPARLEFLHEMTEGLVFPEDVAVSPDGKLLAVTHSLNDHIGVSLHVIDPITLAPAPTEEVLRSATKSFCFHGLHFSPDSRHLAFTEIGASGIVEVVRVASLSRERTCMLENRHAPLKPKSVAFSNDGRFAAMAMATNASHVGAESVSAGILSVHAFDATNGVIAAEPLAELESTGDSLAVSEMCRFLLARPGQPYRILTTNHATDTVSAFEFDAKNRTLTFAGIFTANLTFPHGLDVSADGEFVAIANYGDDTLRIARVVPSADAGRPAA